MIQDLRYINEKSIISINNVFVVFKNDYETKLQLYIENGSKLYFLYFDEEYQRSAFYFITQ